MKKLVNKILVLATVVILIAVVSSLFYFKSFAELTPSPVSVNSLTQVLEVDRFTSITNGRGIWRINIEQADTQSLAIYCGDNIFDNYLEARVQKGELLLNIKDEFKYANTALMDVWIKSPNLISISPESTSVYWLKNVEYDTLRIDAAGASLAVLDTCNIDNLFIKARDYTSIKSIEGSTGNLIYYLSGNSIAEFSNKPEDTEGKLFENAFIKMSDISILTPNRESVSKNYKIKPFPGLPLIENAAKLDEYMLKRFGVIEKETFEQTNTGESPYLNYFFSHLGRTIMTSPARSYTGGEFLGQRVFRWQFYYLKGITNYIDIFFPEETERDTIISMLKSFYGDPVVSQDKRIMYTASWNNKYTGVDSSLNIKFNEGLRSSCYLSFQFDQVEKERSDLQNEWAYYNHWKIGLPVRKIIERAFLNGNTDYGNGNYKSLPSFFY